MSSSLSVSNAMTRSSSMPGEPPYLVIFPDPVQADVFAFAAANTELVKVHPIGRRPKNCKIKPTGMQSPSKLLNFV